MNIVVDTNVFISALIKDGTTRKIIINSDYNFLFPEFEFYEIKKHKLDILQKSGLPEKEFDILLLRLLNSVKIIPADIIVKFRKEAFDIIGEIDPDDAQFVATALAFNAVIWSDDKHCQEPPVKDRWHEFATLRVVLEHVQNSTRLSNHSSKTSGILTFKQQNKIKALTTKDIINFIE